MAEPATDWEIARIARLKPIVEIARDRLGIPVDSVEPYGRLKAKIDMGFVQNALAAQSSGKLILVTAISPTTAGEVKTTVSIGLGDGLNRIGKKALICLREPSLGLCFGMKGGATGGGYSQVVRMDDINLHFTGDFHAIGSANNLLAAMIDNHIYWGNSLGIDPRRVTWRRCVDMNERALRQIVSLLGGVTNGFPREDGFDITVAPQAVIDHLKELEKAGFGTLPVCITKTQYSFSADSRSLNAPSGFAFPIREIRLAAGAEFVVAICGDIMAMPGLPRVPRAEHIRLDPAGYVAGL